MAKEGNKFIARSYVSKKHKPRHSKKNRYGSTHKRGSRKAG